MLDMEVARERGQVDQAKTDARRPARQVSRHRGSVCACAAALPGGRDDRTGQEPAAGNYCRPEPRRCLRPARRETRMVMRCSGRGATQEAAREFEAYARIAPREPNPHDSLGEAYLKAGDAEKAAAAYARALAVDPTFPSARTLHAWSLAVLGRFDAALAGADRVCAHFKAMILSRTGRYREAAQVLDEAEKGATARGDVTRIGGLQDGVGAARARARRSRARAARRSCRDKFYAAEPDDLGSCRARCRSI